MARFDVYRLADGALVLDCQNDRFDDIGTRFCIPLVPSDYAPPHNAKLNPVFRAAGEEVQLITQFATSVRTSELRQQVDNLERERDSIIAAMDVLIGTG